MEGKRKKRKEDDWSGVRGTIHEEVKDQDSGKRRGIGLGMCVVEEGEGRKGTGR